ncbi:MAG: hypothetical protein M3406_10555 [Chloroflexota bacterium]|nr:hypothetical protein [Chloroflexota bacterium]
MARSHQLPTNHREAWTPWDPIGFPNKVIELAYQLASSSTQGDAEILRRFRIIYGHMAITVGALQTDLGQGPYGPMGPGMPGMQMPDTNKLLADTEKELEGL